MRGPGRGPIEAFLRGVRTTFKGTQGRITNLPRLGIRLGLLAASANREADEAHIRARLAPLAEGHRLDYRALDSQPFSPVWVLEPFPLP